MRDDVVKTGSMLPEEGLLYHGEELSEQINWNLQLVFSFSQEEMGDGEARADCREIVIGIDRSAVW